MSISGGVQLWTDISERQMLATFRSFLYEKQGVPPPTLALLSLVFLSSLANTNYYNNPNDKHWSRSR